MRLQGRIRDWDTHRGFGFIAPEQGGQDIFAHVTSVKPGTPRVKGGQLVTFEVETTPNGKKRAKNIEAVRKAMRLSAPTLRNRRSSRYDGRPLLAIPAFLLLYLLVTAVWHPSIKLAALYAFVNASTYVVYAMDKSAARSGLYRIPEKTLHMGALMGG